MGPVNHAPGKGSRAEGADSRGPNTEVFGALIELTDPRARLGCSRPRARVFSPLGELMWYLSGSDELAPIDTVISLMSAKKSGENPSHQNIDVVGGVVKQSRAHENSIDKLGRFARRFNSSRGLRPQLLRLGRFRND